ncbi:MAG: hypothetical protein WD688_23005 [Candidatus Binatia bacterium]
MTSVPTVLDYVAEILESTSRPLLAKEICDQLAQKGLAIERPKLTQILWKQNDRIELVVDKQTFKWRYDFEAATKAAEAAKNKEETRKQLEQNAAFLELWENIGFEFIGVWRDRTDKPFFFLSQNGDYYRLVGHAGNFLVERSYKCSPPDTMPPEQFTSAQIKKTAEEILRERHREAIDRAQSIINMLRDTVSPPDDVYVGPAIVRVGCVRPGQA